MKILFNLANQRGELNTISQNDIALAYSILAKICQENGFQVSHGHYDPGLSFEHGFVYESIKNYAEEKLLGVHVTDYAVLANLGNLQFQLTTH